MSVPDHAGGPREIARRGLRDQVYDALFDLIVQGSVAAGERLRIDGLAADLRVSQTPVREALANLERTGLVTREGFKGYRVAEPLTDQQGAELMDAREMIEIQATRWYAAQLPGGVDDLRAAHAGHVTAAAEVSELLRDGTVDMPAFRHYFDADAAFHRVIYVGSGNHFLMQMATDLGGHLHRLRETVLHRTYDMGQAVAEHAAVLKAAEAGDPDRMVAAMQQHMAGVRERSVRRDD
ncbi:GntR family transcriptional regulator [Microlunatus soli]|uniref:DNA-binding transcriptional regulator, GntR family n=1 Tax=Microlunatus soli TaxID=630515 RepID=A0A1H1YP17_9ACTN|nr:GntR family transcriptional regulator [Microlunatus soli]SDT23174.1 DNA-binding transcriptional regulator, GntR family [Microlunatus soli]